MDKFIIRKATAEDMPVLKNILDSATLKLLKKGVQQWEYPWEENTVRSFVDKNEFYVVLLENTPCGCFGIRDFSHNYFIPQDKTGMYWYHLAVHPDAERSGAGQAACMWVQQYAAETGRKIYFDCWAGNKSLVNYYTFMNFQPLGEYPEEDYFVMAFST